MCTQWLTDVSHRTPNYINLLARTHTCTPCITQHRHKLRHVLQCTSRITTRKARHSMQRNIPACNMWRDMRRNMSQVNHKRVRAPKSARARAACASRQHMAQHAALNTTCSAIKPDNGSAARLLLTMRPKANCPGSKAKLQSGSAAKSFSSFRCVFKIVIEQMPTKSAQRKSCTFLLNDASKKQHSNTHKAHAWHASYMSCNTTKFKYEWYASAWMCTVACICILNVWIIRKAHRHMDM